LLRHSYDIAGNLEATAEVDAVGVVQLTRYHRAEDLSVGIVNLLVPLTYLPRAVRGGHLVDLGGIPAIRFGSRVYIPAIEVFLSPDPYVPAPLAFAAYNRYRLGYNDPRNWTDPRLPVTQSTSLHGGDAAKRWRRSARCARVRAGGGRAAGAAGVIVL